MIGKAVYPFLASHIRNEREARGRSQEYVASRIKMSLQEYELLERGKSTYRTHVLYAIADILEMDVRDLLIENTGGIAEKDRRLV